MKIIAIATLTLALGGCSRWDLPPVPVQTSYNLDGTGSPRVGSSVVRRASVRRSVNNANASIETTGSVAKPEDQEDALLSQIITLKANTPEWLALRQRIQEGRIAQNKRELARITICNC